MSETSNGSREASRRIDKVTIVGRGLSHYHWGGRTLMAKGITDRQIDHLLRRAGFGARPDEIDFYSQMSITDAVDALVNYDAIADDADMHIGQNGYVGTTTRGVFSPNSNITDSRQRWLFRMVHSDRPLQEKMTLFWHNHFATGYNKIAGAYGAAEGARYMAAKASEDPAKVRGPRWPRSQVPPTIGNRRGGGLGSPARLMSRVPGSGWRCAKSSDWGSSHRSVFAVQ